jgi:SAM-dependent methyltransferase
VPGEGDHAAVICMGSSQAVGSFADALAWAFRALRPGGVALFGDGYWKHPPPADYLDVLGATADEMGSHADNAARAREVGFRVLRTMTCNDDEWDEYEGLYCNAVERYVEANPDDPDASAMAQRIRRWHDAYLRWGRDTLGFGFYFLLKPS